MSGYDSKLYKYAVEEAKQAVILDREGKYQQAINKYLRAAEILVQYMTFTTNPEMRKLCQKNSENYIERAKILKSHISGHRPRRASPSPPASSDSPKDDKIKSEGGEFSEEEQEMIDMISGTIVTESPDIGWKQIAGLENCKQALREAIVLPMLKPELFVGARKPWAGILLFGPPGCGKTLLAKAAATECKATFFSASSVNLRSCLVRPCFLSCVGRMNFLAISSFSSSMNPENSITSIRSRTGPGISSTTLAVVTKITSERSKGIPR